MGEASPPQGISHGGRRFCPNRGPKKIRAFGAYYYTIIIHLLLRLKGIVTLFLLRF